MARVRPTSAETQHRGHAIIERVFAELIDGPLAHLPSGRFNANNVWLACITIAHNLTRAAAILAGRPHATARAATIRRQLINVAGRISRHAGEITIHLPQHWPWRHNRLRLFTTAHAPPT
ncbi:transposase [Dactylosporangium sp. NPDC000244]|uniref:transposase n=1 Tax=Dactylosporangium sp. NPDC000244 TaxID=3154365 RepID=UPI00332DD0C0